MIVLLYFYFLLLKNFDNFKFIFSFKIMFEIVFGISNTMICHIPYITNQCNMFSTRLEVSLRTFREKREHQAIRSSPRNLRELLECSGGDSVWTGEWDSWICSRSELAVNRGACTSTIDSSQVKHVPPQLKRLTCSLRSVPLVLPLHLRA